MLTLQAQLFPSACPILLCNNVIPVFAYFGFYKGFEDGTEKYRYHTGIFSFGRGPCLDQLILQPHFFSHLITHHSYKRARQPYVIYWRNFGFKTSFPVTLRLNSILKSRSAKITFEQHIQEMLQDDTSYASLSSQHLVYWATHIWQLMHA